MANPTKEQVEAALLFAERFHKFHSPATVRTALNVLSEMPGCERVPIRDFCAQILASEVRRLRELCSSKNAENEDQAKWQPIATAPKDGTDVQRIIVWDATLDSDVNAWWKEGQWCGWVGEGFVPLDSNYTHWRPIPPAPETEGVK